MEIKIEKNNYLKHFFKKYKRSAKEIEANIYYHLPLLLSEKPYKIKNAGKVHHLGHQALEYKIVVGSDAFRAAFICVGEQATVFFISEKTIKEQFMTALEKINVE